MPYLCHYNSAMASPSTFLLVSLAIPSSWETENKRHGSIKLWDSHFNHSHTDQEGEKKLLWASMSSTSRLGVLGEAAREHSCADCSAFGVRSTSTLAERSNPPRRGWKWLHAYRKQTAAVTDLHLAAPGGLDLCDHLVDMSTALMHTKDCNWLFSTCPPQRSYGRIRPIKNSYFNTTE